MCPDRTGEVWCPITREEYAFMVIGPPLYDKGSGGYLHPVVRLNTGEPGHWTAEFADSGINAWDKRFRRL